MRGVRFDAEGFDGARGERVTINDELEEARYG